MSSNTSTVYSVTSMEHLPMFLVVFVEDARVKVASTTNYVRNCRSGT